MSSYFNEIDVDAVKLVLNKRDASTTTTVYMALDFWDSNTLYAGSPVVYPLLVSPPSARRGVDVWMARKFSVTIDIYAKTNLTDRGMTFADLLEQYELHTADASLLYYSKPLSNYVTHTDAVNIRQTLKVTGSSYSEPDGILSIRAEDVFFRTKELSKRLDLDTFPDMDMKYDGEYGPIVFGQSTVSGQGVLCDAPFIASSIDGSNRPNAKIFSGFTFPNHPNKAFQRLLVRNQYKEQDKNDWVQVSLESDPQTAGYGESVASSLVEPSNYGLDLSRYARAVVDSPSANATKILTAVRAGLQANTAVRCVDMIDGQHLYNSSNIAFLTGGDTNLTIEIWIRPDAVSPGSDLIICRQGAAWTEDLEWQLYLKSSTNKYTFAISTNGTTFSDSVSWSSTASAATWTQIIAWHDKTGDEIGIAVNNGTAVTTATGGSAMDRRSGAFMIGSNNSTEPGFDGRLSVFRYWRRVITGAERTTVYNSGTPITFEGLPEANRYELRCSYDFTEPVGIREDSHGSADLTPASNNTSLSPVISYNYSTITVAPDNSHGDTKIAVYHATSLDSGNTYNPVGGTLRDDTIDITDSDIQSGTANAFFQIDPPLVKAPDANYITILDFENSDTNIYYPRCAYDSNAGSTHYAKDKRTKIKSNWEKQIDTRLDMQFYYLGDGDDAFKDGTASGTTRYSYYHLEAKSITLNTGQSHKEFNNGLEFKIGISGLKDDGSGTYTGSASAVIENPSDIIRFILMNSDFGLGLSSTYVDTSSLDTVRTSTAALGLTLKIVIDSETDAEQLIADICRQSRIVFYKLKNGKLALKFPTPISSFDVSLSQGALQGEMQVLSVADNDYSQAVNEFRQFYKPDILNQPNDPSLMRRDAREKLAGKIEITPSSSSSSDAYRQALAATSQSKYGKREFTYDLSFYDSSTPAQTVQNYYCDRYSTLQKRFTLRVPRRTYYNSVDLFSNISAQHVAIPSSVGTAMPARQHYNNTPIVTYNEGVPVLVWSGGQIEGQVYEIEESGPWMIITGETVSIF